ncbi:phage tail protein [Pseudoxanthomonas mexicana]|uniref:phage tail protein n=1 Tax=Pseudoxanthomonas mexicana TaxID=128785 RepID=UPI0007822373|nr:phage tail protein [Pseudoxanthomonas mexicana]
MAVLRDRPYAGMNFLVDLGTGEDGAQGGVSEVTFPDARLQLNEYRNGNDKTLEATKLSTLTHYGHLVLRRGVIGSLAWYQWWDEARNGGDARRSISVTLLDEQGNPAMRWRFLRARPAAYQTSSMDAALAEALFETLEIAFDRFELE